MNKTVKSVVVVMLLVATVCGSAFAKSATFSTSVATNNGAYLPKELEPSSAIIKFFADKGIDTSVGSDVANMSIATRNSIKSIYSDNKSTIDSLAQSEMKKYLAEGKAEYVTMKYGPITWTLSYTQDSEDSFSF